jgi:DNA (cytosine-5)-methyltransferase 1
MTAVRPQPSLPSLGDVPKPARLPMVDVFSGAGGLSLGLSDAGFEPIEAVERDRDACETYSSLHPDVELDVGKAIEDVTFRRMRGEVALLAGGPPCQPFSTGGKRLGSGDDRDGFPEFLRALREIRPDAFLVENVAGLGSPAMRPYFARLIRQLRGHGFSVSWKIVNAADYGVPQKRRRLFIVGMRRRRFQFPSESHGPGRDLPWEAASAVLSKERIVGESNTSIVTYAKKPDLRPSPYDGLLFNGGGRPIDLMEPAPTVLAAAGGNRTPFVDTEDVVPPYHAHLVGGGSPRKGTVSGARRITVEESARLQTFPPEMSFAGTRSSQYTQVGDAVPPTLAKAMGRALHAALEEAA